eukprot:scaffold196624_cov33-Tisochrysis_lutea.AAC.4
MVMVMVRINGKYWHRSPLTTGHTILRLATTNPDTYGFLTLFASDYKCHVKGKRKLAGRGHCRMRSDAAERQVSIQVIGLGAGSLISVRLWHHMLLNRSSWCLKTLLGPAGSYFSSCKT